MELARALTSRKRHGVDTSYRAPNRSASTRDRYGTIKRSAISAPLELISTTNALAFNAPNIYGSSDESDSSMTFSGSSRATTPEVDEHVPVEPNHLSTYFPSGHSNSIRRSKDSLDADSPTVPCRALSHTKKSHQAAARKRTASQTIQPPSAIHSPPHTPTDPDMFSSRPEMGHPFGAELAQVNEIAEGFSAREVIIRDDEEQLLMSRGLCKFAVEDYLDEITGGSFINPFSPFAAVWI